MGNMAEKMCVLKQAFCCSDTYLSHTLKINASERLEKALASYFPRIMALLERKEIKP